MALVDALNAMGIVISLALLVVIWRVWGKLRKPNPIPIIEEVAKTVNNDKLLFGRLTGENPFEPEMLPDEIYLDPYFLGFFSSTASCRARKLARKASEADRKTIATMAILRVLQDFPEPAASAKMLQDYADKSNLLSALGSNHAATLEYIASGVIDPLGEREADIAAARRYAADVVNPSFRTPNDETTAAHYYLLNKYVTPRLREWSKK